MHQSQPQGIGPNMDADARPNCPARRPFARLVIGSLIALALVGCATESRVSDPLTHLGNPFDRPSESGFRAMATASCGSMGIGDRTVGELMRDDASFNRLVSSLYAGDISNDEFMNQVLLEHPAPDANVPATGCIINQLARCFAEECKVQSAAERAASQRARGDEAMTPAADPEIDPVELPSQDQAKVDAMIDGAEDADPKPLP